MEPYSSANDPGAGNPSPSGNPEPYPPRPPIFNETSSSAYNETASPGAPPPPPQGSSAYRSEVPPYASAPYTGAPTKDERNWAMFAHISALVIGALGAAVGFSFLGFVGPLVIYLMKKDESAFIADQAKEALNFYISVGIIMFVLFILSFTIILMVITIPAMLIIGIGALILSIMAAVAASNGQWYRYPFTLRLIK